MTDLGLTPEAIKAVETAEKLMRLAGKNPNEHEAAAATAKAMDLLAAFNLDISIIEQNGGEKSKRADEKLNGGLYQYQRSLWAWVADLNFCLYWNQYVYDPDKISQYWLRQGYTRDELKAMGKGGYRFQHRVVGRQVNVVTTKNMTSYLETTINRLTKERLHGTEEQLFGKWAVQFREGVADAIINKIIERRRALLREDQIKAHEAREAANRATEGQQSTSSALTLSTLKKSEEDANLDFLYGEGYSAKKAAKDAARAKKQADADAEYTRWAAEHPEEAAAEEEAKRKARKKEPWNKGMGGKEYTGAYWEGREVGKGVSIDPQMDGTQQAKRIGK